MFTKTTNLIKAALLVTALMMFSRPALADSWPTSFGLAELTIEGKTFKAYRGTTSSLAQGQRDIKTLLEHIGKNTTTEAEVYSAVQVADSIAFNMEGRGSKKIYTQFEKGLRQLKTSGDGANSHLASIVHKIYKQMRLGDSLGIQKTKAWAELKNLPKTPATTLIVASLRNDISDAYQYRGKATKKTAKTIKSLNARSQRNVFEAASMLLFSGSKDTPSQPSAHDRKLLTSYMEYAGYYDGKKDTAKAIAKVIKGSGNNKAKIVKLQGVFNKMRAGNRLYRLPGFEGRVNPRVNPRPAVCPRPMRKVR